MAEAYIVDALRTAGGRRNAATAPSHNGTRRILRVKC
jgi:hypothetical protein